jgi:DMSO/TMAO reductase YedYZ molybdopterin-dependent catalytic subunit
MSRIRVTAAWPTALAGLLAGAVAVGAAELVAAAVRPEAAPVVAVGSEVIDRTPTPLKEFAIRNFGTSDKTVLLSGILVLLALFAAAVGVLARRRLPVGLVGIGVFGAVGVYAALHRPASRLSDAIPSLAGALAGCVALVLLIRAVAPARVGPAAAPTDPVSTGSSRTDLGPDRRRFLVNGLTVAAVAGTAGLGGRLLQRLRFAAQRSRAAVRLPAAASAAPAVPASASAGVPGVGPYLTPNAHFYRVDTALLVPQVPAATWSLRVHGMVAKEFTLSYADLLRRPTIERVITLACVSNEVGGPYVGNARWLGVPLKDLLAEAGVGSGADQIVCTSADGMTIGVPTRIALDGRDAMLAVGMNGEPLPLEHGFPVRMVVPGLYGYCSACKWLVDMELSTFGAYDAYWAQRGWARVAAVKTESRIDTPRPSAHLGAGTVPVAGVAWAQHRGIAKVEVRVDGGAWQPAKLSDQVSTDAWRQWVYPWRAIPGTHTLAVRATDGTGQPQTDQSVPPFPNGASGWHSVVVTVG